MEQNNSEQTTGTSYIPSEYDGPPHECVKKIELLLYSLQQDICHVRNITDCLETMWVWVYLCVNPRIVFDFSYYKDGKRTHPMVTISNLDRNEKEITIRPCNKDGNVTAKSRLLSVSVDVKDVNVSAAVFKKSKIPSEYSALITFQEFQQLVFTTWGCEYSTTQIQWNIY